MKKFFFLLLILLLIIFSNLYATEEINSGDDVGSYYGENEIISGEKDVSGDVENKAKSGELSEEGASVDKSDVENNYRVEAPTIVLLSIFGVLVLISLILIIFKI